MIASSSGGVEKEKRGSSATVRACDSCRRRKRKCVWKPGVHVECVTCSLVNEECATTHVRKPRAKSQKRTRIAEYEARVQRLESLLEERTSAQPLAQDQPLPPADESISLCNYVGDLIEEINSWPVEEEGSQVNLTALDAGLDMPEEDAIKANTELDMPEEGGMNLDTELDIREEDVVNFDPVMIQNNAFGDFHVEPDFLQNLSLQQQQQQQQHVVVSDNHLHINQSGNSTALKSSSSASCDGYLPPPELGTSLLSEFLVDFNTAVPLYRPYLMAEHIRACYMGGTDGTALSWASTYIVFGIAHRLRAMSAAATPEDNEQADYYLSRIMEKISNLLFGRPNMCLVQCLLGAAVLIQTSPHPEPHTMFVSTALRMAQYLAYNDEQAHVTPDADGDLDSEFKRQRDCWQKDAEQQRRIFWIAFFTSTEESILSNMPTAHLREDIITTHPEEDPHDAAGAVTAAEGSWRVNIFALRAKLALLQAEAIEQVVSAKCSKMASEVIVENAVAVLKGLQTWRNHELFQMKAEELLQLLYRSDLIHVLNLEAAYFATVFRVQAFLVLGMNTRINPFSTEALVQLSGQPKHVCLGDAKRLLSILAVAPQGDIGVCWFTSVVAALVTVLSYALHHAADGSATPSQTDMREYRRILQMLKTLAQKSRDAKLQTWRELCMMLFSKVDVLRGAELVLHVTDDNDNDNDNDATCIDTGVNTVVGGVSAYPEVTGVGRQEAIFS
ncbi:hypothetical protein K504DRAFT_373328 [Pleomassaria siparia CBS 279.74]|uniref:Zn(2)-C6 fungal-type domain-containing protein n=1 Tax=Pleomassaria siparia CBS 279.74 TaxID=1314801 RepID=A0A6G1KJQ9_9PLEO|nr:hypothetical protein K504DRAFT_373328 [Pleomassaria siparia CBS 279.74]